MDVIGSKSVSGSPAVDNADSEADADDEAAAAAAAAADDDDDDDDGDGDDDGDSADKPAEPPIVGLVASPLSAAAPAPAAPPPVLAAEVPFTFTSASRISCCAPTYCVTRPVASFTGISCS